MTNAQYQTGHATPKLWLRVGLVVALFLASPLHVAAASPQTPSEAPAGYEYALFAADTFLFYWLRGHTSEAFGLLSPRLKKEITDPSWFKLYVHGLSNPHHQAFEVSQGTGSNDRYQFTVTLYEIATGNLVGDKVTSTIVLVRQKGAWLVDRLPLSSDNPG